jgi:predicted nucleic acid-binding protein
VGDTWVVNASPVIALAKVGHLRLLEILASPLVVPEAVAGELLAGPADDPAAAKIAADWGERRCPKRIPEQIVEWGLGEGESAVLALCLEDKSATAVLDDAIARAAGRALGIPLIGTLGVLVRGKKNGLLTAMRPVIDDLRSAGLFLDAAVIRSTLELVGE